MSAEQIGQRIQRPSTEPTSPSSQTLATRSAPNHTWWVEPHASLQRVFISYRRDDSPGHAGRLFDRLAALVGRENVFIDTAGISAGQDFVSAIEDAVLASDVMLAVIGPGWLAIDEGGSSRIWQEDDFVRQEILLARSLDVPLLPVLVNHGRMPGQDDLPEEMAGLTRVNAVNLDDARWEETFRSLVAAMGEVAERARQTQPHEAARLGTSRRQVTIVSVDIVAEAAGGPSDPDVLLAVEDRIVDAALNVLGQHGAASIRTTGVGILAVFGVPAVSEDDPLRALRAAMAARDAANRAAERERARVSLRVGVRTGLVVDGVARHGLPVAGAVVDESIQLAREAGEDEIAVDNATLSIVGDVATARPTSRSGPDGPVRSLKEVTGPFLERDHNLPLVGRERERELIGAAFRRCREEREAALVTILGEPGVGKSRLVLEFLRRLDATILEGRCLPYGEGITYRPIAQALRGSLSVSAEASAADVYSLVSDALSGEPEAGRVIEVIGQILGVAEGAATPDEVFWAFRRTLAWFARDRPLVLLVDDLQWADDLLMDLLEDAASRLIGVSVLIIVTARSELMDLRPTWGMTPTSVGVLRLSPLTAAESRDLAEAVLGGPIGEGLRTYVMNAAGGNPLFEVELLKELAERGTIVGDGGSWAVVTASDLHSVPQGAHAILSARIGRLSEEEREVLQCASAFGQEFTTSFLEEIVPEVGGPQLRATLRALERRDMIRPSRSHTASEDELSEFRHVLIRDVAYDQLPKARRADLHEAISTTMEDQAGDRLAEVEELLGYHLEQTVMYRTELGWDAAPAASRAADHLGHAGQRALLQSDIKAASGLLSRASLLLEAGDPRGVQVALDRAEALREMGELTESERLLVATAGRVDVSGDAGLKARLDIALAFARAEGEMAPLGQLTQTVVTALDTLHGGNDESAKARAHLVLGALRWWEPDFTAAETEQRSALEHARLAGDLREEEAILAWLPFAWVWGPAPVHEALEDIEQLIATARGRRVQGKLHLARAGLLAMNAEYEQARADVRWAGDIQRELGQELATASGSQTAALVESLAGDVAAAVSELLAAIPILERIGEAGYLATTSSQLAAMYLRLGRSEEARAWVERARSLANEDDPHERADWGPTLSRLLAQDDEDERAVTVATEAVEVFHSAGMAFEEGNALLALSDVHLAAGRTDAADAAAVRARARFTEKGVVAGAGWADERLDRKRSTRPPS